MAANWYNQQVNNNNYLSPIGFKFILEKAPKVAYLCQTAAIPEITLGSIDIPTYLVPIPIEGNFQYSNLSMTFLVDENLENYLQLHNWMRALGVPTHFSEREQFEETVKYPGLNRKDRNIFSDGTLQILTNNMNNNFDIQFVDLIPISLSTLDFDATVSETNFMTATVSFTYTYYEIRTPNGSGRIVDSAWYNQQQNYFFIMNLEQIQEMWKKDSEMDADLLCEESLRVPQLHMKYFELFNTFALMKKENEYKLKTLIRDKWKYYKGKAPKELYKEIPFDLKLTTKDEVEMFLDADEDIQKAQYKLDYIEQILTYLDSILRMVNNRSYQIKNAIEWERFKSGVQNES